MSKSWDQPAAILRSFGKGQLFGALEALRDAFPGFDRLGKATSDGDPWMEPQRPTGLLVGIGDLAEQKESWR